jgi:hypothetical protein
MEDLMAKMREIVVNGLILTPSYSKGDGNNRVPYCIVGREREAMKNVIFPPHRVMVNLAKKYLGCRLDKDKLDDGERKTSYFFIIDGGIKIEKRAAFLAAVVARSEFTAEIK